jgi:alpha-amylase
MNSNGNAGKLSGAFQSLYKSQCNCSYWHGVFGGLYLHHLRSAVFENLIQTERGIHEVQKNKKLPEIAPLALESGTRWQVRQKAISSVFNPKYGGAMEELDVLSKSVNVMCNLQRHKEPYHDAVLKKNSGHGNDASQPLSIHQMLGTKEKDLEKHLHYDQNRRLSFLDHFFVEPVTAEQFSASGYVEAGDFVDAPYKGSLKRSKGVPQLHFTRKGNVRLNEKNQAVEIQKWVTPKSASTVEVRYAIKNVSRQPLSCTFGVEFNFSIGEQQAGKGLNEKNISEWTFHDSWRGLWIRLNLSQPSDLLTSAVETVSESESGLERTYQELGVLLQKPISLAPGKAFEQRFELAVS